MHVILCWRIRDVFTNYFYTEMKTFENKYWMRKKKKGAERHLTLELKNKWIDLPLHVNLLNHIV